MGVGFVFLLYVLLIGIVCPPLAAIGVFAGGRIARHESPHTRRTFRLVGAALPFCAGAYLLAWIVGMAIFGVGTGRDFGFGDGFDIPLHDGYRWSAIDEPISACVYQDNTDGMSRACGLQNHNPNAFVDVLSTQEHGDWIAGGYDSDEKRFIYPEQQRADRWFLFNTKTHERFNADNAANLALLTAQHGFLLHLESSSAFYAHHRYRWYDELVALLLLLPGILMVVWLYKKARLLLRESADTTGPDSVKAT
jgi:hypothetical protein